MVNEEHTGGEQVDMDALEKEISLLEEEVSALNEGNFEHWHNEEKEIQRWLDTLD